MPWKPEIPNASRDARISMILMGLACLWLVVFLRFAFTLPLANHSDYDRLGLIFILPEVSTLFTSPEGFPAGWRYLPERFDIIAIALFISAGAWAWGRLACRALRLACDDWLEHLAIAQGLGLSLWSLATLFWGLAGQLHQILFAALLIIPIIIETPLALRSRRQEIENKTAPTENLPRWLRNICLAVAALFISRALLGSMLPPFDFDVREYHLGGPKEWFLDGRVHFLPHNVYTSFPFLTEMLSLSSMVLRDDWYRGAIAGKLLLATYYPLTTLAVYVTGRRLFGPIAGLLGMLVYATTPWSYRIAAIAYAEGGLTCYLILALLACTRALLTDGNSRRAWTLLAGLLAGSAMACKYPGVVQVVIPIGLALLGGQYLITNLKGLRGNYLNLASSVPWRQILTTGTIYTAGVCLAVGPWLIKNLIETGNPVYPLMWALFDGTDWNAALNEKWHAAHHATNYSPGTLVAGLKSIAVTNDWQSILVFAFVPLAFLSRNRRAAKYVALYLAWLFFAWWGLTHRIDRFWVPLLPVACLLAGLGMTWPRDAARHGRPELDDGARQIWRWVCGTVTSLVIAFNYLFITSPLIGNPHVLTKLAAARQAVENPNFTALNKNLPKHANVLLVGEADIFDARFPIAYNTVFDKSLLEEWTAKPGTQELKDTEEIREKLQAEGITHVFVNWREILRYRTTYGYTKFVTPERVQSLQQRGILDEAIMSRDMPLERLDNNQQREAIQYFSTLIEGRGKERMLIISQLYPVNRGSGLD